MKLEASEGLRQEVSGMRGLAVRALAGMYLSDQHMFCFCVRRGPGGDAPEGMSRRYTAIVLIGLAAQRRLLDSDVFGDTDSNAVCERLLSDVDRVTNLGDVALTLWAAVALGHGHTGKALERLRKLDPVAGEHPTVEIAWSLAALTVSPGFLTDRDLSSRLAERLIASFNKSSNLFAHWPVGSAPSLWRSHVTCFADFVYPVHALSHYHMASGDGEAIEVARSSAAAMCRLQGDGGQWWWHYDVRTGRVVERYPVYSVHQDAMAPMALFAVEDACGVDCSEAVRRGLQWLIKSPERGDSLVDKEADLIWRKVCRREPGKLVRGLQAASSRLHPSLRMPGADLWFPPVAVDYECRPYHLGWLLYAFNDRRVGETDCR